MFCYINKGLVKRAVSSVGRAPALQAGCHQFESGTAHLPYKQDVISSSLVLPIVHKAAS